MREKVPDAAVVLEVVSVFYVGGLFKKGPTGVCKYVKSSAELSILCERGYAMRREGSLVDVTFRNNKYRLQ